MARITCLGGPGRARRKEAAAAEGGGAPVDWDELLSAREKQQLALARLFHHKVASPRPPGPAPLTFKSLSSALGATGSADAHCIDVRRRCRRASDARGPARAAQPAFAVLDESMTGLGELERRLPSEAGATHIGPEAFLPSAFCSCIRTGVHGPCWAGACHY